MAKPPPLLATSSARTAYGATLSALLPQGAAGTWCHLRLGLPAGPVWWAKLELTDRSRGQVVREVFLGPMQSRAGLAWRDALVHVPPAARSVDLILFGPGAAAAGTALLTMVSLSRARAGWRLLRSHWRVIPGALAGSAMGGIGRVRAVLGQAPARAGQAPSYADWISWFETPPDESALQQAHEWNVAIVIVTGTAAATEASRASCATEASGAAEASRASGARQCPVPPVHLVAAQADWAGIGQDWVILLQAGEILAPGALARFAQARAFCPWAEALTADCDHLDTDGKRHAPVFKPGPDALLLPSGLPVRGACALRWQNIPTKLALHGETARRDLAMRIADRIAHIPGILSHIGPHFVAPSATQLAPSAKLQTSLTQCYLPVTILAPSAARARHVVRCVSAIARGTNYPALKVKLVLSNPASARRKVLDHVARLPQVRIVSAETTPFNYAAVNNHAARATDSHLLLLMNDDVSPIDPDWLSRMVAHLQDPSVGIVGARLLYGNGMVQHEGVIMGLANLCEHAGRLRAGDDPGPHGIGLLDREVCAVTGACLLIRASLYRALGGMDEAFAVALNDVDLCLRAREAGFRVVYCAQARLHHYESLSLGRHYAGGRAALESIEVQRLRQRFAAVIAADPFYSPLASLQPGREWQPAFPPRAHPHAVGSPQHPPKLPAASWK